MYMASSSPEVQQMLVLLSWQQSPGGGALVNVDGKLRIVPPGPELKYWEVSDSNGGTTFQGQGLESYLIGDPFTYEVSTGDDMAPHKVWRLETFGGNKLLQLICECETDLYFYIDSNDTTDELSFKLGHLEIAKEKGVFHLQQAKLNQEKNCCNTASCSIS